MTEPADTAADLAEDIAEEGTSSAPEDRTFEFMGETFRYADRIAAYPIIKFQRYSDSADDRAMQALFQIIETAVHADDWARFEDAALASAADDQDLMGVVNGAVELMAADVGEREARRRAIPQDHQAPSRPRQQPVRTPRSRR
jgi:hypothetical protein